MHTRPEMLIIPVSTPEGLPETMAAFIQGLLQPPPRAPRLWAVKALLPFCSISPPLGQHNVNVLSVCFTLGISCQRLFWTKPALNTEKEMLYRTSALRSGVCSTSCLAKKAKKAFAATLTTKKLRL